ncbi:MAG: rhomboid family intramembrane serine protease [Verrucomicrobiota bacterium]
MFDQLKSIAPWTRRIIILNCVIAALSELAQLFGSFDPIRAFLPLRLGELMDGALWQLFTYMWVHAELFGILVMHLLFNMLTLYFIGKVVEYRIGARCFLELYLIGGLVSVGIYLLDISVQIFVLNQQVDMTEPLVGASGSICALLGAFSLMMPDVKVYIMFLPFPVRAITAVKGFAIFSFAAAILGWIPSIAESPSFVWLFSIAHSAHLGGILCGWYLFSSWTRASRRQKNPDLEPEYVDFREITSNQTVKPPPIPNKNSVKDVDEEVEQYINRILEKISSQGIHSLTPKEVEILEKARKKRR